MKFRSLFWLLGVFVCCLPSCTQDNIGRFDSAVVESESNTVKFKQVTFTINVVNGTNNYLNVSQIDSVKLKVNGKDWGTFQSESIDTTYKTNTIANDLQFSSDKISYLVIAPYQLKTDKLETAGDYVNYLNDRIVLTPGDYVCEVSEIKFRNRMNQWVTQKPHVYKDFKIVTNTSSSFVGEITVTIK